MFGFITSFINHLTSTVNENLEDYTPSQIIVGTMASYIALQAIQKGMDIYRHWNREKAKEEAANYLLDKLLKVPYLNDKINKEINKEIDKILLPVKVEIDKDVRALGYDRYQPEEGQSSEEILELFEDVDTGSHLNKLSGARYAEHPPELMDLLAEIYKKTAYTNPLHSCWKKITKMQAELINWGQTLFNGEEGGTGLVTHGGSTSIDEACYAYVQSARERGILRPEIIVPVTAHVAFDKAARRLGAKIVKIPVDETTGKVKLDLVNKAINRNTAMMVGSACSFMDGICDDIEGLGEIAEKNAVSLHVDGCLGGFLTAYSNTEALGLGKCDFRVKGVTSISADLHKYGQAPKGSSLLLFRKGCPHVPTQVDLKWRGGLYVTPGTDGSRSGAPIASAYAVMRWYGQKGYRKITEAILSLSNKLRDAIKRISKKSQGKAIHIMGDPKLSVTGFRSRNLNIHLIAEIMKKKHGWELNLLQKPDGFHFCMTSVHTKNPNFIKEFIAALEDAIQYAKEHPHEKVSGTAKAYGTFKSDLPIPRIVEQRIGRRYNEMVMTLPEDYLYISKYLIKGTAKTFTTEELQIDCNAQLERISFKSKFLSIAEITHQLQAKAWPIVLSEDETTAYIDINEESLSIPNFTDKLLSDLKDVINQIKNAKSGKRSSSWLSVFSFFSRGATSSPVETTNDCITNKASTATAA